MNRPVHVLMVEDSADDAELLLWELRRQGFVPEATLVDTGPALRNALADRAWDVVISDHNMPGFSGDEALKIVRQLAPDVPFIVVSGTRGEEHAVDAMRGGANDFIVKARLHRLAPVVERELREAQRRIEQRRTANALAESQQQLRQAQKLEAVGRLAGGVAHDFNNLMAAILAYADLVLKDMSGDDLHRADLEEIRAASGRASKLTLQLLAFSRAQVIERVMLDLVQVLGGVWQLLRRLVGDTIRIDIDYRSPLWPIRGDQVQIEQVLMNLVTNARDAMPGGGTLSFVLSNAIAPSAASPHPVPAPGEYVKMQVSDTGEGIPADVLSKIFEPYFTTKPEGTGLGLATVYGIVQQMGGSVFVDSPPGSGAVFTIYLPRGRESAEDVRQRAEANVPEPRIVVVDDGRGADRDVQLLIGAGFDATLAHPSEVLAAIERGESVAELLIMPVALPGLSGPAFAVRAKALYPGLRVMFVAEGGGQRIDPLEVFEHGELLLRPFAASDLIARVRETLPRTGS
jgi:signal transduction histidine kinase